MNFNNNNNNENIEIATINALSDQQRCSEMAVFIKNLSFGYNKKIEILSDITLTVPIGNSNENNNHNNHHYYYLLYYYLNKGTIFSLLGSSGCGKTTLLKIVLGQIRPRPPNSVVKIFGQTPAQMSKLPSTSPLSSYSTIGYMPQELALFSSFTIEESLLYYGLLHHIKPEVISSKINFFIQLLSLPSHRLISQCSGGQQRRASLAVALLHQPRLLILDEPTVGVDPLLRCQIWKYLEELCQTQSITVIITTHYIEESRAAHKLAFLRFGRILAQDSPEALLRQHDCQVLESVFIRLCQQDCATILQNYRDSNKRINKQREEDIKDIINNESNVYLPTSSSSVSNDFPVQSSNSNLSNSYAQMINTPESANEPSLQITTPSSSSSPSSSSPLSSLVDISHMKALLLKNVINLKRNPMAVFFSLILPVVQIVLYCVSVNKMPNNLSVSVYNSDNNIGGGGKNSLAETFFNCLDKNVINLKRCNSTKEAVQNVIDGKSWYAITVTSANFTDIFKNRLRDAWHLEDEDFEDSKIALYVDHSDNFMRQQLYNSILHSYQHFAEKVATQLGLNNLIARLPIKFEQIVYGHYQPGNGYDMLNSVTPAILVLIIYTTPLIMAAFVLVFERLEGALERTLANGATAVEIFLTHLITLMIALTIQLSLLMFMAFTVFNIEFYGSLLEVFVLLYLQGLCGIMIGLFISSISTNGIVALVSFFILFQIIVCFGINSEYNHLYLYLYSLTFILTRQ